MKPAHRGLGNSHGKENKALIGLVSGRRQDQHDFPGLRKLALMEWVNDFRPSRKRIQQERNARRRAENEAELARINEQLRHAAE
jgi:hypothetical protein